MHKSENLTLKRVHNNFSAQLSRLLDIMLQSDSHRIKSSRGRKGQDPFDPPESVLDTNWLAAYNQFKQKQLTARKNFSPRGGFRGRGFRGRGGFGPPRGFQGPPRGQFNRGGRGRGRGGPPMRGGFHNQGYNQGYNQGFNQHRGEHKHIISCLKYHSDFYQNYVTYFMSIVYGRICLSA